MVGGRNVASFSNCFALWGGAIGCRLILKGHFGCKANFPVFQSMSGLYLVSQGKPRMIFCFTNLVMWTRVFIGLLLIVNSMSTKEVIFPFLFSVPSTFRAMISFSRFCGMSPMCSFGL